MYGIECALPGSYLGSAHSAPRFTRFGISDLSSGEQGALGDERRDVDRDRERQVVPAAVVAELGVGLVGVGEEVERDLDAVLRLERRDRVLADVLGPVVDEELGLGGRDRRRLGRGGRRPRRQRSAADAAAEAAADARRRRRRGSPRRRRRAGGDDRRERRRGADRADPLEELAARDPSLDHVAVQSLLEVDARPVVVVRHAGFLQRDGPIGRRGRARPRRAR